MSRQLARTTAAGALIGVSIYVGSDVIGEYTTYCALRDQGIAFAAQDEALIAQIGTPFEHGPWYNASIGFMQSGHIAAITFPLKGSKQITDVSVRAVRRPGLPSTALYNLSGGEWKVLDCSAMAPQPGGNVRPRSIVPFQAVPKVQDGKVVAGEECEECNRKAAGIETATGKATGTVATPDPGTSGGLVPAPAKAEKQRKRWWFF